MRVVVDSVVESALHLFDEAHGGFGSAPKFPHASAVDLLLERYQSSRDPRLLHVVERTLTGMAEAVFTISWPAASIAIRWTSAGACRTSRK